MLLIKAWEEKITNVPEPFKRKVKVLIAPDKGGVEEIVFSHVVISPDGKTDNHKHDRPELIYIVSGEGVVVTEEGETPIKDDMVLWVYAGEMHQLINTSYLPLKIVTLFVPGYTEEQCLKRCLETAEATQEEGGV